MKTETKITNHQLMARALWLAFQASSSMGLGFLHAGAASKMTEESLVEAVEPQKLTDGTLRVRTDYVFGRMMKTTFEVSTAGKLTISPEVPRPDYQSWAGSYASASALATAVERSLA